MKKLEIIHGDCLSVLATLPEASVQTCVTSPPYWGLRDYKVAGQLGLEKTPEEYVAKVVAIFKEVKRVLKNNGTCWLNLGDSYNSSPGGWYPHDGTFERPSRAETRGLRKKLQCDGLKTKDLIGIPWRVAFALQADGWWLRQDIIWEKPNPMPESVTDRCTKSHEYIFLLSKSAKYFFDNQAIKEPCSESFLNDPRHKTGSTQTNIKTGYEEHGAQNPKGPHRLFNPKSFGKAGGNRHGDEGRIYDPAKRSHPSFGKTGGERGDEGHPYRPSVKRGDFNGKTNELPGRESFRAVTETRNKRDVWSITSKPFKGSHFAVFPEELPQLCIKAGSRPGDLILDPFHGAGTTGLAARRLGRRYLGIELNEEYIRLSQRRIERELGGLDL